VAHQTRIKLIPLGDWNEMRRAQAHVTPYPRRNGLECPDCGKELRDRERAFRFDEESQELRKIVDCWECRYEGWRLV